MKQLALGILAHVDAGKTTLSEALLYQAGQLKKLGRVDHRDAFLDTDALERERGITIFSKQALLEHGDTRITLVDTPGHVDFSGEAERALSVLDCAVLVLSGPSGVQSHTATLWRLLERLRVPTFIFVNKMDLPGPGREALLAALSARLGDGCVDFGLARPQLDEQAALCDEAALERYLEQGALSDSDLTGLIAGRRLFPVFFGSALRLEGVDTLLDALVRWAPPPSYGPEFGARVWRVARDAQGARLTWLKVTGGALRVKSTLSGGQGEDAWSDKVDQIRLYSGARFQTAEEVPAGTVCAVTGLGHTRPGQGLGFEAQGAPPALRPVLAYQVLPPEGCDPHTLLRALRQLEEEDPQLEVSWGERTRDIHIRLMGEVQLEIVGRRLKDGFGLEVTFGPGATVYLETITAPVVGVGHFEPLRHYAEVHLLLEPLPRGAGLVFKSACSTDVLGQNYQRLVLTHLAERPHLGVLTGAPITDMAITLLQGQGHVQYTAGGDFREATYRAVRQGLMQAESVLLEPWYDFRLEVPEGQVGRAMSDIRRMHGDCGAPQPEGEMAVLQGSVPVAALADYAREVTAYTRGLGRLELSLKGYLPCHNQEEVVAAAGYEPERDTENPASSVFCVRGVGETVPWREAKARMHLPPMALPRPAAPKAPPPPSPTGPGGYQRPFDQDRELRAIFERTYGPIRDKDILPVSRSPAGAAPPPAARPRAPECLLVDGYNIIFAWPQLKKIAQDSIDTARQMLCDLLCNYQGVRGGTVILVFDAYRVARHEEEIVPYNNIFVVYTKEAETADAYIEKTTYELGRRYRVRVASSDSAEQLIILGHGAIRLTAEDFYQEAVAVDRQIEEIIGRHNIKNRPPKLGDLLEGPSGPA